MDKHQALIVAADRNDAATVTRLLREGADVHARDGRGRTALLAATDANHVDIARLLINAGSNVNGQDDKLDSPLLLAGASGQSIRRHGVDSGL